MNVNQKGFMQWLVMIVVLVGLAVGVYLVQQQTNLRPKAVNNVPIKTYQSTQGTSIKDDADLMKNLDELESMNIEVDPQILSQNEADLDNF
jgi:hypothetical protein